LQLVGLFFCGLAMAGGLYGVLAALVAHQLIGRPDFTPVSSEMGVSILKPLHGASADLERSLATAFDQTYSGPVQVIFGLHKADDPAAVVAETLRRQHPERDISVVMDRLVHGTNGKISNLINMLLAARHDILVLSDADIALPPAWLSAVVRTLAEPGVGAVSCFYGGAGDAAWRQLAAMGISYHFLPNALVGVFTGLANPCFGSTIALTRQTLSDVGGLERFANCLADDYEIGHAVREKGLRIAYPRLIVEHRCDERSLGDLWQHELRWARTIRLIDPLGHWGSLVTHPLPLALIGAALLGFSPGALIVIATVVAARLFLKYRIDHIAGAAAGPGWLLPARDVLSFAVFLASLFGNTVSWRGERRHIKSGAMT
jgi:ceramide glucosyltransferase